MLLSDQNVQVKIIRLFLYKPRISRTLIKVMQGTCDMDKYPGKYFCMDQSSNKGIYNDYVKKDIQYSFKTMNIEVLGIFQKGISS